MNEDCGRSDDDDDHDDDDDDDDDDNGILLHRFGEIGGCKLNCQLSKCFQRAEENKLWLIGRC